MILDDLDNAALFHRLGDGIARALRYLSDAKLSVVTPGRYEVDGNRIVATVSDYPTKLREHGVWEAHRQHIDVQCVQNGEERVGYAPLASLSAGPYDPERDVLFAEGDGDFVLLRPGRFVILYPQDAHMPGIAVNQTQPVRKIVIKVAIP